MFAVMRKSMWRVLGRYHERAAAYAAAHGWRARNGEEYARAMRQATRHRARAEKFFRWIKRGRA